MDTDERVIALKKAYADVILNTAKEAAVRVAVSEKKAVRLEKELNESKGQALQMLIRLKKMMDCKILEAEMTSFDQQRKIQELNGQLEDATDTICKAEATSLSQNKKIEEIKAQLNEAEEIVKDLREELKEAYTALKNVRKNKFEVHAGNLNVDTPNLLPPIPKESILNDSQPIIISSVFSVSHEKISSKANINLRTSKESFVGVDSNERKSVIPSILLKSKGPEFCGNRRTQRIRAFEEKLMAGELSFTDRTYGADANYVEKKVLNLSVTGQRRKIARCKKKKISSTRDLYNRTREIEDREDNTRITHERDGSSNEELIENDSARNTLDDDMSLMDVKKENVPAVTIETITPGLANEIDDQPVTERVFKYTFQRKRKRESMSSSSKKSTVERPNCPVEEEKRSSIIESSRDSRRLALVAHQLIS